MHWNGIVFDMTQYSDDGFSSRGHHQRLLFKNSLKRASARFTLPLGCFPKIKFIFWYTRHGPWFADVNSMLHLKLKKNGSLAKVKWRWFGISKSNDEQNSDELTLIEVFFANFLAVVGDRTRQIPRHCGQTTSPMAFSLWLKTALGIHCSFSAITFCHIRVLHFDKDFQQPGVPLTQVSFAWSNMDAKFVLSWIWRIDVSLISFAHTSPSSRLGALRQNTQGQKIGNAWAPGWPLCLCKAWSICIKTPADSKRRHCSELPRCVNHLRARRPL